MLWYNLVGALAEMKLPHVRKYTFGHMRQAKIQISLRIRAVWSESSLGEFGIVKEAKFLHVDNGDFNQTARMHRLIWVFVRRTCQKICYLTLGFINTCTCSCRSRIPDSSTKLRVVTFTCSIIEPAHDKTYNKTCDQRRLRSACLCAQYDQSLRWSHVSFTASGLPKKGQTINIAILGGCTDWTLKEPLYILTPDTITKTYLYNFDPLNPTFI